MREYSPLFFWVGVLKIIHLFPLLFVFQLAKQSPSLPRYSSDITTLLDIKQTEECAPLHNN